MASKILNKDLNYVVFTKRAKAVSDFDVESAYQRVKDMKSIEISSLLLLNRFRLGVKRGEIKQFNFIVEDLDGKIYEEIATENGNFNDCWNSTILNLNLELCMELI